MPNGSFNAQALWGNQRDVSWTEFDGLDGLERLGDSNDTLDVGDHCGCFFGEFQCRFDTLLIELVRFDRCFESIGEVRRYVFEA